tara:strand:+ start:25 stop:309 length:285 start_codon:yes stop_codon:yes gene_type:complete
MNQIGGMVPNEMDYILDMAGIEDDAVKIKETFGVRHHDQLDHMTDRRIQEQTTDKSLVRKALNYMNQTQVTTQTYKFKVFSNETKDVTLNYNHF